jgi:two-component system chemotaxis response regulator CheB
MLQHNAPGATLTNARHPIVVIAASAGGLELLRAIIAGLPARCDASIFIVWHIGAHPSELPTLLRRGSAVPVAFATEGAAIQPGHVYIAPPDRHVLIGATRMRLSAGPKVHFARPAADPMFMSAAATHGDSVIGVVLSGGDGDGAAGLLDIKREGGKVVVQDPAEASVPSMPHAAISAVHPDAVLPISAIVRLLGGLCAREQFVARNPAPATVTPPTRAAPANACSSGTLG